MYETRKIQATLFALKEMQQAGVTFAEATRTLHIRENIPFDDIWPAIMKLSQTSEKEAMQLTKKWCLYPDK